jgi:hypothetical protein
MRHFVLSILLITLCTGCLNYTKEMPDICNLHKVKMKKVVMKIHYGYSDDCCYSNAPNGSNYVNGGCVVEFEKFAIGYRCTECKKIWIQLKKEEKNKTKEELKEYY